MIPIAMAGLENAALRIAIDAQHQGHEFLQWNNPRAFPTLEVELGGLGAAEVAPKMIPFVIRLDGRDRLSRKKGDPV
jgi:hypothetical protein